MAGELTIPAPATSGAGPSSGANELFRQAVGHQQAGRLERAIELYRHILVSNPDHAAAWNNLGVALRATDRFEAAAASLRRGVAINPQDAGAWSNLGNALRAIGDYEAAAEAHERSLALDPAAGRVHYNLALVRRDMGQLDLAQAGFVRAVAQGFKSSEMFWDWALTWLVAGDLERGFREYEWRWQLPESPARFGNIETWDGAGFEGRTLLVHVEQGFGDTIQFLRYLPMVAARGGRVIFECPQPLLRLVRGSPVSKGIELVEQGSPIAPADLQIALLSLPRVFGTTLKSVPADCPYLQTPSEGPALQIPGTGGLRVGLVWAGKPTHKNNRNRSMPLERLMPLLDLPQVRFVGLQKGDGSDQPKKLGAEALVPNVGERMRDFADTASIIRQLDLVISVDTSIVHLCGALDRPVWALIPYSPDWRWLYGRDDTPWYPSVRLFRQNTPRDWSEVVARVRHSLETLVEARTK